MNTEIQRLLILICTNSKLRRDFFSDRNGFCISQNVNDDKSLAFFNSLQQSQIQFFAEALLRKRYHTLKSLLPVTFTQLDEKDAWNYFCEFASGFSPAGIHKHQLDAIGFADYLLRLPETLHEQLRDVLRYEQHEIKAYIQPPLFSINRYRYRILNRDSANSAVFIKKTSLLVRIKNRVFHLI